MDWFLTNAWLIPLVPSLSFVIILLFGKKMPHKGSEVGVASVLISFALAIGTAIAWIQRAPAGPDHIRPAAVNDLFLWFKIGPNTTHFGIHIDGLAVMLLFVVGFISSMVHIFSLEYLRGDRRYTYYFAALSLFTASMFTMVTAANSLQLLLGWEGMGVCSFMLIGHWWEDKPNSDAALKAFFTTRTGDIGLLVGITMTFFLAGQTFDIEKINAAAVAGKMPHTLLLFAGLALMAAVVGKSAQFPLHTWLPDAMAGPTPVSALIHAATMVVAGVYLISRFYGVFSQAFHIFTPGHTGFNLVAIIGGVTIIIAALLAFVQHDIKKVLAYSTVSQLGYMVMALGCGAWTAAIFHLFTHAFFKADLFLGAGSVSHSGSHHSFVMKKEMGGLRKHMPVTFATFVIGSAALAGIFPLAGFWSKDEILASAGHNGYTAFMVIGVIGAMMTAGYMTRCVWLTFYGEYRGHGHPAESPRQITVPLIILTAMAVVAGWFNGFGLHYFSKWTENPVVASAMALAHATEAKFSWPTAIVSSVAVLVAIGIAWAYYEFHAFAFFHELTERSALARAGYEFVWNKYYLDRLWTDLVVGSIKTQVAAAAYWFNQNVLDGVVNGVAAGSVIVARFTYRYIDQDVVDGLVNGTASSAEGGGSILRKMQTGRVQQYAAAFFGVGVVVIGIGLLALTHSF
ncbi:MAG: NADH-quinone oxidoreductase subunit [Acidimicrobiaceae bacterium]|nr:NADH-quinone oxidoreductase subunit [Acidimicrobiaceae bacterium]